MSVSLSPRLVASRSFCTFTPAKSSADKRKLCPGPQKTFVFRKRVENMNRVSGGWLASQSGHNRNLSSWICTGVFFCICACVSNFPFSRGTLGGFFFFSVGVSTVKARGSPGSILRQSLSCDCPPSFRSTLTWQVCLCGNDVFFSTQTYT